MYMSTPAGIGQVIPQHFKVISILQNRITYLDKTLEPFGTSESFYLIFSPIFSFFFGKICHIFSHHRFLMKKITKATLKLDTE